MKVVKWIDEYAGGFLQTLFLLTPLYLWDDVNFLGHVVIGTLFLIGLDWRYKLRRELQ